MRSASSPLQAPWLSPKLPGMKDLKLALIGCGAIARYHLDGILGGKGRITVTAVVDTDPDKAGAFAAETGATAYVFVVNAEGEASAGHEVVVGC